MPRRSGQGFHRYLEKGPEVRLVFSTERIIQRTYKVWETGIFLVEGHGCEQAETVNIGLTFGETPTAHKLNIAASGIKAGQGIEALRRQGIKAESKAMMSK